MQNIPSDFILNIVKYGYLIIVMLVFLQEVGFPNPIPNEFVLLFSGYLGFTGMLNIPLVLLSAIAGDLLGSSILYSLFFLFGRTIMLRKPRWFPISLKKIHKLSHLLQQKGTTGILIGRISPFIRGYVSVLMGLINFPAKRYFLILLLTSIFWACFYVLTGYFIGPYWSLLSDYIPKKFSSGGYIVLVILLLIGLYLFVRKLTANTKQKNLNL